MIGIDIVDVARLGKALARSPGLERRMFTQRELDRCNAKGHRVRSLAGTLAAKEAVIKALGLGPLAASARRIEVLNLPTGAPVATVDGTTRVPVTISHDGPVAAAVALSVDLPVPTTAMGSVATPATGSDHGWPPLAATHRALST